MAIYFIVNIFLGNGIEVTGLKSFHNAVVGGAIPVGIITTLIVIRSLNDSGPGRVRRSAGVTIFVAFFVGIRSQILVGQDAKRMAQFMHVDQRSRTTNSPVGDSVIVGGSAIVLTVDDDINVVPRDSGSIYGSGNRTETVIKIGMTQTIKVLGGIHIMKIKTGSPGFKRLES